VECAAIATDYLGSSFDVQAGGSDLVFPHHEMSASHARVACPSGDGEHAFARVYAHSGMVAYQGAKMSKSLGNLVFVSRLRAACVDPMAIRLALVAHHYRSDWEWTDAVLAEAQARLSRWRAAVAGTAPGGGVVADGASPVPAASEVLAAVRMRLADDLDAPGAVAAVDAWADAVLAGPGGAGPEDAALVRDTVDALLGVAL
jgi:L-cysteine:1D-myo-inositol 2-amino-2-deoxy-alpha-D-glucopyranoside ligase